MLQIFLRPIFRYLALLLLLGSLRSAFAQCGAPTSSTQTITDQVCPGTGSIDVTGVAGGSGTYQYALYDQANTVEVKPWQDAALITNVTGNNTTYTLRIRSVCSSPAGFSTDFTQQVTVGGEYNQPVINGITVLQQSQCTNGRIRVDASQGVWPYEYALVDSQDEPEPVGSYVRPKQTSEIFDGLEGGTYFVRVYDACGSFVTQSVTVATLPNTNPLSEIRLQFLPCDEIRAVLLIPGNTFNSLPLTGLSVTYPDGTTAALGIPNPGLQATVFSFPISKLGTGGSGSFPDNVGTWPKTITFTATNSCGTYTLSRTYDKPCLPTLTRLTTLNETCTGSDIVFRPEQINCPAAGQFEYLMPSDIDYSTDGGTTWQTKATNGMNVFITLPYNTAYNVCVRYCGRVLCSTGTTPSRPFPSVVTPVNSASACPGNSGFNAIPTPSSATVTMISAPAGQPLTTPVGFINFVTFPNLALGTYTIRVTDQCGQFRDQQVTLRNPFSLNFNYYYDCGNNLVISFVAQPSAPIGVIVQVVNSSGQVVLSQSTNGSTNMVTFMSGAVSSLPQGQYTIRMAQNGTTCFVEQSFTLDTSPLSLSQSLFTSACGTTGTVVAVAQGSSGYQYSLNEGSLTGPLVAGPQSNNIFNNLDPSKTYVVSVSDGCGRGTNYTASFSNAKPVVLFSATTQPCVGQSFQISVANTPGATFQWFKDGNPISGATSYVLNFPSFQSSDAGTYAAQVSFGNCVVLTNNINLGTCNGPLPVRLRSFTAKAQPEQQTVQLQWITASERNNSHFLLERSKDLIDFQPIARVNAKEGNSLQGYTYSYIDATPYQGTSYYRLRQVDHDGTTTAFPALSVVLRVDEYGVFPNPVGRDGAFTVKLDEPKTALINLYNAQGRACGLQTLTSSAGSLSLKPVQPLPPGIYTLTVAERGQLRQFRLLIP